MVGSPPRHIPSDLLVVVVVAGLLAGLGLPASAVGVTPAAPPSARSAPLQSGGNGTLQCDGMYWDQNITAWYEPSYCYGHDEPTISYLSNAPGSGRNASFQITLPSSNTAYSQGDFYATIWFGGTVNDPLSLDGQAFLEFQFYPAPPAHTGTNSGSKDCLANGAFNEAWTSGTNDWFACAVVWGIYSGAEENAANPSPLDVYGLTDSILVMHSGDHLFVNYTGVAPTAPWHLNVVDTTSGQNGSIALENSTRHVGLGPYYARATLGNILDWGASGPGAIAFAYEIGHSLNPSIPVDNSDGGCTPGDLACDSYWPGRWGKMGQMELGLPVLGTGATAGFPLKMYYSSSQEGEAEVNASTSPVGSTCPAPSFSTSKNCLYPWYQYRAGNYSLTFGATDVANSTHDYGNEYEFPGVTQPNGLAVAHLVKAPWAWLNVTVAPSNAQVEVNPLATVNPLPSSSTGTYSGQYLEGDYWINASAPGCQSASRGLYLRTMVNETVGIVLTCPGLPTVPVSFLENGLPTGSSWTVDLSGITGSASGRNITFNVTTGSYPYLLESPVPGSSGVRYATYPTSGTVRVGSSHLSKPVPYLTQYQLNVSGSPATGGTVSPAGTLWENASESVTLTATPGPGDAFAGWVCAPTSLCPSPSSDPMTVIVSGPGSATATFVPAKEPVSFLEQGLPLGTPWSVVFDGTAGTARGQNITFNVTAGTYSYRVASPLSGGPGVRYLTPQASGTLTVGARPVSVPEPFTAQYLLMVSSAPTSDGHATPSNGWYGSSTPVTLQAYPSSGYRFTGWTSPNATGYRGPNNPETLTLGAPLEEVATFAPALTYDLTFQETGIPAGTLWSVNVSGTTLSSTTYTLTFSLTNGTYAYASAQEVHPNAPGLRYQAAAPTGTVTVTGQPVTVNVAYDLQAYLTVSAGNGTRGTTSPPSGWFTAGTLVELQAAPLPTFVFSGWLGTGVGSYSGPADPSNLTLSQPVNETATFSPAPPPAGYVVGTVTPPNALIVVGGRVANVSVDGAFNLSLPPGRYPLNASVAGYVPYQTLVTVLAGKSTAVAISLTPAPSPGTSPVFGPPALEALYLILPPLAIVGLVLFAWHRRRKRRPTEGTGADGPARP